MPPQKNATRVFAGRCSAIRPWRARSDASQQRTGFGSSALKVDDKIFAMLVKGWLVVKLPEHRVDTLVALGEGERYDPGGGRFMKEWVTVGPRSEEQWLDLAREALEFVSRRSAA